MIRSAVLYCSSFFGQMRRSRLVSNWLVIIVALSCFNAAEPVSTSKPRPILRENNDNAINVCHIYEVKAQINLPRAPFECHCLEQRKSHVHCTSGDAFTGSRHLESLIMIFSSENCSRGNLKVV